MTDLSYSHGQLAKNWLRWHGLGYPTERETRMTMTERTWQPPVDAICAKCGKQPPGPGGILCPECRQRIEDHQGDT
jgi:hypothetical protein